MAERTARRLAMAIPFESALALTSTANTNVGFCGGRLGHGGKEFIRSI